jgi:DNA/RNA endonuclease YhcR with UshA esterase domain
MFVALVIGVVGNAVSAAGALPFLEGNTSETIIVKIADLMGNYGVLFAIMGGIILAGILSSTMSTADAQLLAASSSISENLLRGFFRVQLSTKASIKIARAAVVAFIAENVSVAVTVNQEGSKEREPEKLTVAQLLAKSDDPGIWYELTGTISNLANETYGNFDLVDETGKIYVYGLTATKQGSNDKSFSSLGLKEGDIVTLKGTRSSYNGSPQVGGPAYYVSHVAGAVDPAAPVKATAAEINAAEDGSTKYQLTGYVSSIKNTQYGNLYIKDATGEVYVYGIKDWANKTINEGDIITVVSSKTSYKDSPQLKNAELTERKAVVDKTVAEFLDTEESKETKLLSSLKPYLNEKRQKKLAQCEKIMSLTDTLKLLNDMHLFDSFLKNTDE